MALIEDLLGQCERSEESKYGLLFFVETIHSVGGCFGNVT